jgi:tRNA pseudouridine38-40 synthase
MRQAAAYLVGEHNFKGFCSAKSQVRSFVRRVFASQIEISGDWINYSIEANGFLYNMVRIIVGVLISVGREKVPPAIVGKILEEFDRGEIAKTAPPNGLFLEYIAY